MPENKTKEIHPDLSPVLLKEHKAFQNVYGWKKNATVVAKSGTKKLVNIKMETSLMQLFHACNLGLSFQLKKHWLRMQDVVIFISL